MNNYRFIDLNEYMPVLIDLINEGKEVPLMASGSSMTPFIVHQRDTIFISKPDQPLKKGDMVFYKRDNGQYVMHRIHHINQSNELFIIGDAQTEIEGPIQQEQVFGIIHKIKRKGKIIQKDSFWWFFFEKIWIRLVPIRRYIIMFYTKLTRKR